MEIFISKWGIFGGFIRTMEKKIAIFYVGKNHPLNQGTLSSPAAAWEHETRGVVSQEEAFSQVRVLGPIDKPMFHHIKSANGNCIVTTAEGNEEGTTQIYQKKWQTDHKQNSFLA